MTTRFHPSFPGFLFLILGLLLPVFASHMMINSDGDPARHVRHGETILEQGDVIRTEAFTFTFQGKPFVGFEYGSQVLLALSHRLGGTVGMAALATLLITVSLTLIAAWLIRRGVEPILVGLSTILVAILTSIHWLARPHLVSWPFMLVLLFWLERPIRPPVWAFGLLFLAWANLHGAFAFGWIMLGFYIAGHLMESLWSRDVEARSRERAAAIGLIPVLLVSLVVTLVNPYGWGIPHHVISSLRDGLVHQLTQEFQSPNFLLHDRPFLFTLAGTMLLLAVRPRLPWTHLMVIVGTAGTALISSRNIVLFGLLAVPLLTLGAAGPWGRTLRRVKAIQRFEATTRTGSTTPWIAMGVAFLFILSLNRGRLGTRQLVEEGFESARFPVDAVTWARQAKVQGRILSEMFWGGYLIYAWPENRVFIDGGADFYGGEFLRAFRHVTTLQPGWRDSLAVWNIELVLMPNGSALAGELLESPAWDPIYCDRTALFFRRATNPDSTSRSACQVTNHVVGR